VFINYCFFFHLINWVGFFWTTQGINIKNLKKIDPLVINFSVQVNLASIINLFNNFFGDNHKLYYLSKVDDRVFFINYFFHYVANIIPSWISKDEKNIRDSGCMHKWVDQCGCHISQFCLVVVIVMPMLLYKFWNWFKWTWF
jgi:hypothetical protein